MLPVLKTFLDLQHYFVRGAQPPQEPVEFQLGYDLGLRLLSRVSNLDLGPFAYSVSESCSFP